jgi:fructose/tagatose bisphosphate aldolase
MPEALAADLADLLALLDGSLSIHTGRVEIRDPQRLRATIHRLAEVSTLGSSARQGLARYLTRLAALSLGILPASIQELYLARAQESLPPAFTVPALNLRQLTFDCAAAAFQAALSLDAAALVFEISRAEIAFSGQRPAEYTTNILAAAIAEGYTGPVFLQGDHFQVSASRYAQDPKAEIQAVDDLIREAIRAGFYNLDIDASTLVDLSLPDLARQQALNAGLTARYTAAIRRLEPPGVTISVGGEIGEVGGHNSTEAELRAFMDVYLRELDSQTPGLAGVSKISIQTGTSHGGVILPDGSLADVNVDFDTLRRLSRVARHAYGMGGAVQHGASTLPESAFSKFVEYEALEVHLATHFTALFYEHIPAEFKARIYAYLDEVLASERTSGITGEQFYARTRKFAIGRFKPEAWNLPAEAKAVIRQVWKASFTRLFRLLGLAGTRALVAQTVHPPAIPPRLADYLAEAASEDLLPDLAD